MENTAPGAPLADGWHPIRATPMFQQHVVKITTAIKDEFDSGVRVS